MVFGYLILILIPIVGIWYIIWDHKRKAADRAAASAGRMHELFGVAPQSKRTGADPVPTAPAPQAPRVEGPPVSLYAIRDRVLSPPHTLLYYLLKTGMPEHVVFAQVTLASVLQAGPGLSGFAREEQVRRLAALSVDFVVTDKSMRPLAVIELASSDQASAAQADRDSVRTRVAAAGVRYVEVNAKALPRKEGIRSLVLGDGTAAHNLQGAADVAS